MDRLKRSAQTQQQFKEQANTLANQQSILLQQQLNTLADQLRSFASKHSTQLAEHPDLAVQFYAMCAKLGITSGIASSSSSSNDEREKERVKKSFWWSFKGQSSSSGCDAKRQEAASNELAVRLCEELVLQHSQDDSNNTNNGSNNNDSFTSNNSGGLSYRNQSLLNGNGLIAVDALIDKLSATATGIISSITQDDLVKCVEMLKPLGSQVSIVSIDGQLYVNSLGHELNADSVALLQAIRKHRREAQQHVQEHQESIASGALKHQESIASGALEHQEILTSGVLKHGIIASSGAFTPDEVTNDTTVTKDPTLTADLFIGKWLKGWSMPRLKHTVSLLVEEGLLWIDSMDEHLTLYWPVLGWQ